ARPAIYTLSLHDALPILACSVVRIQTCQEFYQTGVHQEPRLRSVAENIQAAFKSRICHRGEVDMGGDVLQAGVKQRVGMRMVPRSEEHTSELQSRENLVC